MSLNYWLKVIGSMNRTIFWLQVEQELAKRMLHVHFASQHYIKWGLLNISVRIICFKNPPMRIVKIITMSIQTRWPVMIFLFTLFPSQTIHFHHESYPDFQTFLKSSLLPCTAHCPLPVHDLFPEWNLISNIIIYQPIHTIQVTQSLF